MIPNNFYFWISFRNNLLNNSIALKGKALISDHQFLTARGLSSLLQDQTELHVEVLSEWNPKSIIEIIRNQKPDLFILDYLAFDDGEDFLLELLRKFPETTLLGITADTDHRRIRRMINHGIKGLLTKNCQSEEILTAVRTLLKSNRFYCNRVLDVLVNHEEPSPNLSNQPLSEREMQILQLIAEGFSTSEIADSLSISVHTVNSHRKNMLKKLELKSPIQLVTWAIENGWVRTTGTGDQSEFIGITRNSD
jgi:DNA-binding NarL/FixJ family response regulator